MDVSASNSQHVPPVEHYSFGERFGARTVAAWGAFLPPPVIQGFVAKSALQRNLEVPRMPFRACAVEGFKTAPTVGVSVGVQSAAQEFFEGQLNRFQGNEGNGEGLGTMAASAGAAACVTSPVLAAFNGQTMGLGPVQAVKNMTWKQTGAIAGRETGFIFGLRAAKPMAEVMKRQFGDNKVVEYAASALSGGLGSLAGQPFDYILTANQANLRPNWSHTMRGGGHKAAAVAMFAMGYKAVKETMFNPDEL